MKNIILVTFSNDQSGPKWLKECGFKNITIFHPSNKKSLLEIIKNERPKVIILNGDLPDLNEHHYDIREAIGKFDIDSQVFTFSISRTDPCLPGCIFLERFNELGQFM